MDTSQWVQVSSTTSSTITTTRSSPQQSQQQLVERKTKPLKEHALNCPRCNSTNTKFCYYNNYSLTQPRYFCKTCRRYWTEGGSLRNVPVGGGSRKNKKHSSNSNSSSSSSKINLQPSDPININPRPYNVQGQDLNLGFPLNHNLPPLLGSNFPNIESTPISGGLSAMELLRSTTSAMYGGGGSFGLHEFSSSANSIKFNPFSGIGDHGMQLFPFGDLKQVNVKPTDENEQNKGQSGDPSSIFWSGANLGGGAWCWSWWIYVVRASVMQCKFLAVK